MQLNYAADLSSAEFKNLHEMFVETYQGAKGHTRETLLQDNG